MGQSAPHSSPQSPQDAAPRDQTAGAALFSQVADNINAARKPPRPSLAFNYKRYAPLLDDPDLTDDQKRECLETLWTLILSFIELGVSVSADMVSDEPSNSCGQNGRASANSGKDGSNRLHSKNHIQSEDANGAGPQACLNGTAAKEAR